MLYLRELEFLSNYQRPQIAKMILRSKDTGSAITISSLELYYRAVVIKTAWYWGKKQTGRSMQPNRTE